MQHCPGKRHKGADAVSRNPVVMLETLISLCPTYPQSKDFHLMDKIDAAVVEATIQATTNICNNNAVMTLDHIRLVGWLGFYGISTFVGYLMLNPFLCK